jgi:23S rRNA (guanosine2251-2'-O)-methyltransferase
MPSKALQRFDTEKMRKVMNERTKKDRKKPHRGRQGRMQGGRGSGQSRKGATRFWGRHAVEAAFANPDRRILRVWAVREMADEFEIPQDIPVEYADGASLARLVPADAPHQGIVIEVAPLDELALDDVLEQEDAGPILLLDQVTDPHNIGALFRSAAAFGASAIVTQDRHAPPESGVIAKSASGALDIVPWIRVVNLSRALEVLSGAGYWTIGLDGEAETELSDALPTGKVAIVLGAEGEGLRQNVAGHCDALARLHMPGDMESLNVSNAGAIALYLLARKLEG